jgi:hypothetical protein
MSNNLKTARGSRGPWLADKWLVDIYDGLAVRSAVSR